MSANIPRNCHRLGADDRHVTNIQLFGLQRTPSSRSVSAATPPGFWVGIKLSDWVFFFSSYFPTQLYFKQMGDPVSLKTSERNKFM